ncbi:MAG: ATP-binding protein [Nitrospirota bacterium]
MKFGKFFNSIAFRISVAIAVVIAASTITVGEIILKEERQTLEHELISKSRYLAELLSYSIREPLLRDDRDAVFTLLEGTIISRESIVVYADVYDKKDRMIAAAFKDEKHSSMLLPFNLDTSLRDMEIIEDSDMPIYHLRLRIGGNNNETAGVLRLCVTKDYLNSTLINTRKKIYLIGAAIIFMGIMLGLFAARKILKPILILNEGVKQVGEGGLGVEVPVIGMGEIKELAGSFNKMSVKLKELVDAMKSAQKNLIRTEKLYAIGEFSAGVAHEIRNPLTSIKMLFQTVKSRKETMSQKDIEVIEKEINRIDRIIQSFLAFARPQKVEMSDVSIKNILDEVITITKPKMGQCEIQLEQEIPSELPGIRGNFDALKQVFLNLVLNAIQAMDKQGGTLGIEATTADGTLSVFIKDTGIGIPEKHLRYVFDPFFTTKKDGTGMGLALTHNIINDHSGSIEIKSVPGGGTSVKVELPI